MPEFLFHHAGEAAIIDYSSSLPLISSSHLFFIFFSFFPPHFRTPPTLTIHTPRPGSKMSE